MAIEKVRNPPVISDGSLKLLRDVAVAKTVDNGRPLVSIILIDDDGQPFAVHPMTLRDALAFGQLIIALAKSLEQ